MSSDLGWQAARDRTCMLVERQIQLLQHRAVEECRNRRGLRKDISVLLETAFIEFCANLHPDLSVEVGAHEASFSRRMKERCPQTRVIAFEANPVVFEAFARELKLMPGLEYRHGAISDENGMVELYVPLTRDGIPLDPGIASLLSRTRSPEEYCRLLVPASTLDSAVPTVQESTCVAWLDVEGAQHKIFAGGRRFFENVAAVYIEVESASIWEKQWIDTEIDRMFEACGLLPIMRDSLAKHQHNKVYVRTEANLMDAVLPFTSAYVAAVEELLSEAAKVQKYSR